MIQPRKDRKKKRPRINKVTTESEMMALFYLLMVQLGLDGNPQEASFDEKVFEHLPQGMKIITRRQEGRIYFHAFVPKDEDKVEILLPDDRLFVPDN